MQAARENPYANLIGSLSIAMADLYGRTMRTPADTLEDCICLHLTRCRYRYRAISLIYVGAPSSPLRLITSSLPKDFARVDPH